MIIILIITFLWTGFIFSNSLKDGESSLRQSGLVRETVERLLDSSGISYDSSRLEHIIRKAAHVFEYAVQAALSVCVTKSLKRKMRQGAVHIFFFSLATAVFDEYLQLFSGGRGSSVSDVLLDFCGAVAGFLVINGIWSLVATIKSKSAVKSAAVK